MTSTTAVRRTASVLAITALLAPSAALADQGLRSPDAQDAAGAVQAVGWQDLRTPDAQDAAFSAAPPAAAPSAYGGIDWSSAALGAATLGGLVLSGTAGYGAVVTLRRRRATT